MKNTYQYLITNDFISLMDVEQIFNSIIFKSKADYRFEKVLFVVAEHLYSLSDNQWSLLEQGKEKANLKKGFLKTLLVENMTIERTTEKDGLNNIKVWLQTVLS